VSHYPKESPRRVPNKFSRRGYAFKLLGRKGNLAIYRVKNKKHGAVGYELHKVTVCKVHPKGTDTGYAERLASDSEFGRLGWYYRSLDRAKEHMNRLEEIEREKASEDAS